MVFKFGRDIVLMFFGFFLILISIGIYVIKRLSADYFVWTLFIVGLIILVFPFVLRSSREK